MKKLLLLSMVLVVVMSCKKKEFEPKGPTDVRIKNISDQTFRDVIINIDGERDSIDIIAPGAYSDYSRFETAYAKAEISAKINGKLFSTGPVNYTYLNYQGQMRITYVVWISDFAAKKLEIDDVIPEEPLILE